MWQISSTLILWNMMDNSAHPADQMVLQSDLNVLTQTFALNCQVRTCPELNSAKNRWHRTSMWTCLWWKRSRISTKIILIRLFIVTHEAWKASILRWENQNILTSQYCRVKIVIYTHITFAHTTNSKQNVSRYYCHPKYKHNVCINKLLSKQNP